MQSQKSKISSVVQAKAPLFIETNALFEHRSERGDLGFSVRMPRSLLSGPLNSQSAQQRSAQEATGQHAQDNCWMIAQKTRQTLAVCHVLYPDVRARDVIWFPGLLYVVRVANYSFVA